MGAQVNWFDNPQNGASSTTRFEDDGSPVTPPRGEVHRLDVCVRCVQEKASKVFDTEARHLAHDFALIRQHLPCGAQLREMPVCDAIARLVQLTAHVLIDAVAPRRQKLTVRMTRLQLDDDEGLACRIVGEHICGGRHIRRRMRNATLRDNRLQIQTLERVEHDLCQVVHSLRRASIDRSRNLTIDRHPSATSTLLPLPKSTPRFTFARLGGQRTVGEDLELQPLREAT